MSSTAILLREKSKMNSKKTIETLFEIFKDLNYRYQTIDSGYNCWIENLSVEISVNSDIKSDDSCLFECLVLYVHEENLCEDSHDFDWICDNLDNAVVFENISHGKNMFLEIIYRYMKKYPNDYLWVEWVEPEVGYTKSDVEKIYEHRREDIHKSWLSKKPYYCT